MQESIVNESPRRRIARRVAAAGMALAALLTREPARQPVADTSVTPCRAAF